MASGEWRMERKPYRKGRQSAQGNEKLYREGAKDAKKENWEISLSFAA